MDHVEAPEEPCDLHLKNHFVRWGCFLSLLFFTTFTILITCINDAITHDPDIVNGAHFEAALHVLVGIFSLYLLNLVVQLSAWRLNTHYLKRFHPIREMGTFKEARLRIHMPGPKPHRHAVLLLHGFTASTQEFDLLMQKLEKAGIPFLAPMIPGFGTAEARVLHNINRKDWFRTAVDNFDVLASVAEEVSVVGHSLGGMLGVALTKFRQPKHLILSAPGLYSVPGDIQFKKLLTRPIASSIYIALVPYLPKPIRRGRVSPSDTLDAEYCRHVFQYMAVPIRSVKQLFLLQDETDVTKVSCQKLSIVYGTQDLTVDLHRLFQTLDAAGVAYDKTEFKDSAHNVLEDQEREEACNRVVGILTSPTGAPEATTA